MNRTNPSVAEKRLLQIRREIDSLDGDLLELLNRRAALSIEVGKIKSGSSDSIFKPFREKEVIDSLLLKNRGPLPKEHLKAVYREILSSSRRLQRPQRVAYFGPEGTFTFFAGLEYLGQSADFFPRKKLQDVFMAVAGNEAELGVIPLENSLQGSVGQSLDLFLRYEVYIQAEIFCKISHCLLSREHSLGNVKKVYSHPQALEQCSGWLSSNVPDAVIVPAESTAAAARQVAEQPGTAAIGHYKLSEMVGLNVLARRIEDLPDNWTRFFVIGPTPHPDGNQDKTSLLFTLPDKAGALVNVLQLLARQGINMKKLESRPLRSEKWKYVFFVDVECDLARKEYKQMLKELADNCHSLRLLGSYPAGPSFSGI
ncbi:MAG: prephenate dehydratase [Desulfovibrionales bacterium]